MTNQSPSPKSLTISVIATPRFSREKQSIRMDRHVMSTLLAMTGTIKFIQTLFIVILLVISYSSFVISPIFAQTSEAVDIGSNVKDFFGFTCIQHFIFRIVDIGIILSGLLLLIYLVWGGVEWLTSGGDKTKIENARSKLTNALIGVAIIAAAYAVWTLALTFFGVDISNVCSDNPIPGSSSGTTGGGGGTPRR